MTQAHKTPGNFVTTHPKCFEGELLKYYAHLQGAIYEVMGAGPPGHIVVREVDYIDRKCLNPVYTQECLLHPDQLVTISPEQRKLIIPIESPPKPMIQKSIKIRLPR